jgi:hypothetical protein
MNKTALNVNPALLQALLGGVMGGAAGFGHGYYLSPEILKYKEQQGARNLSAFIDTLTGAATGTALGLAGRKGLSEMGRKIMTEAATKPMLTAGKYVGTPAAVYAVEQYLPVMHANQQLAREAAMAQANSAREQAQSAKVTSIPYNLQQFAQSGLGRGLAGGAAVAGIGGLLTGLLRRRNLEEERRGTGRGSMVGSDMLKFLLPAMAAGGILGSLKQQG